MLRDASRLNYFRLAMTPIARAASTALFFFVLDAYKVRSDSLFFCFAQEGHIEGLELSRFSSILFYRRVTLDRQLFPYPSLLLSFRRKKIKYR